VPANLVKGKLLDGGVALGHAVFEFGTPGIARILQAAGADFVTFDMEHAVFGIDSIRSLIAYTRGTTVTPFVRVPTTRYEYIAGVLDAGAQGILVPLVEDAEQVQRIVDAARYEPRGHRGIAYGIAHDDFVQGDPIAKMQEANDEILLIAMIESAKGLNNLEEIASHPEIDVIWIGHYDLAASLGVPGNITHPRMIDAFDRLVDAAQRHGKLAGRGVGDVDTALTWIRRGFRILTYSRDILMLQSNLARGLATIRAHTAESAAESGDAHGAGEAVQCTAVAADGQSAQRL
jgi:2-dehydro-3-deoxyglucarate aldolase/4-hydroxy-2-oxoheptanedioate aldolase